MVVLVVKFQVMVDVCCDIVLVVQNICLLMVFIVVGLIVDILDEWLVGGLLLVWVMFNMLLLVGKGVVGLFVNVQVKDDQKKMVELVFESIGLVLWVDDENFLYVVIVLFGSGFVYFFLMLEVLEEVVVDVGIEFGIVWELVIQIMVGVVEMVVCSEYDLGQFKCNVMFFGGIIEQVINIFEFGGLCDLVCKVYGVVFKCLEEMVSELVGKQ